MFSGFTESFLKLLECSKSMVTGFIDHSDVKTINQSDAKISDSAPLKFERF